MTELSTDARRCSTVHLGEVVLDRSERWPLGSLGGMYDLSSKPNFMDFRPFHPSTCRFGGVGLCSSLVKILSEWEFVVSGHLSEWGSEYWFRPLATKQRWSLRYRRFHTGMNKSMSIIVIVVRSHRRIVVKEVI